MEAEKCSTRDNLDNSSVVEDENCAAVEDNVRVAKNTFTADQSLPELTRNFGPGLLIHPVCENYRCLHLHIQILIVSIVNACYLV